MSSAIKAAIKTLLGNDATFTGLVPDTRVFANKIELSRQGTAAAFDANGTIQRSLLIKQETTTPFGPHTHTGRLFIPLIFYDHESVGAASIEAASLRAYQLLHDKKQPFADLNVFEIMRVDHLPDQEDSTITNAITLIDRYLLIISIA